MRSVAAIVALGLAGVLAAAGIGIAANEITGDSVGLSAEPLSAGDDDLAPPAATRSRDEAERAEELRERRREREERADDAPEAPSPTPTAPAPAPPESDDGDNSGPGSDSSGRNRGRNRGRGGDD